MHTYSRTGHSVTSQETVHWVSALVMGGKSQKSSQPGKETECDCPLADKLGSPEYSERRGGSSQCKKSSVLDYLSWGQAWLALSWREKITDEIEGWGQGLSYFPNITS